MTTEQRLEELEKQVGELSTKLRNVIQAFNSLQDKMKERTDKAVADTKISDAQRKRAYVMIKKFADHIGEDVESAKTILKQGFLVDSPNTPIENFSLSDCTSEDARGFMDFITLQMLEHGVPTTPEDIHYYNKTARFVNHFLRKKQCCICGEHEGVQKGSYRDKPLSLCPKHISEFKGSRDDFVSKYYLQDYFR